MATTTPQWDAQVARLIAQFPKFRVKHYSDSKLWGWLKKNFLKWAAATTVGQTVYFDDSYFGTDRGAETLKHEGVHVADYDKWGVLMDFTYFLILPTVFTMRAIWEWRGYREDLRSIHEQYKGEDPARYEYLVDYYSQWVSGEFCGLNYFFMFPFRKAVYNKCRSFVKTLP